MTLITRNFSAGYDGNKFIESINFSLEKSEGRNYWSKWLREVNFTKRNK